MEPVPYFHQEEQRERRFFPFSGRPDSSQNFLESAVGNAVVVFGVVAVFA